MFHKAIYNLDLKDAAQTKINIISPTIMICLLSITSF